MKRIIFILLTIFFTSCSKFCYCKLIIVENGFVHSNGTFIYLPLYDDKGNDINQDSIKKCILLGYKQYKHIEDYNMNNVSDENIAKIRAKGGYCDCN